MHGRTGKCRLPRSRNSKLSLPLTIHVKSSQPVLACLASQYAGWSIKHEENGTKFQALGSGPARALSLERKFLTILPIRMLFNKE